MAKAIRYQVPETPKASTAEEELQTLLETLHQQGLLRIANDTLQASPDLAEVLLNGLNRYQTRNAVQNLSLILMSLGRVPPERFALIADGLIAALNALKESASTENHQSAPGITGVLRLLRDDQLWRSIQPLLAAVAELLSPLDKAEQDPAARRDQEAHRHDQPSAAEEAP